MNEKRNGSASSKETTQLIRTPYKLLITLGLCSAALFFIRPMYEHCLPVQRDIAITIDDLPFDSSYFDKTVRILRAHHVPAVGFVIANRLNENNMSQLTQFQHEGFVVGSHTYSHPRLKDTPTESYINDIDRADQILAPLITGPKYFRYPHLSQGKWGKKKQVQDHLAQLNYIIAPVTIDSKDFKFNLELLTSNDPTNPAFLKQLKQRYLSFVWQQTLKAEKRQRCAPTKQILLLHANLLNSYFLDDVLTMYENNGYRFITLDDAKLA